MATFTLYSANSYQGRKLRLYCTSTTSIANNTSTINWTLYSEGGSSSYYTTGPTTVNINGTEVYYKGRVNWDKKTFPASKGSVSGTLTVTHNSDGKKAISVSLSTAIYTSSVTTNSGTWTLDDIPRYADILSAPDFNDTQNPTITYSNPAGSAVSSLQACISLTGASDDIAYRDIPINGTSYTFELTEAERNVLRQATTTSKTRNVIFFVRTIISGNTFHTTLTRTLTIVNANPTFDVAYLDSNSTTTAITGNNQQIIQNNSTLQINITNAAALKYATLSTASVNINGVVTTQSLSSSSLTLNIGTLDVSNNLTVPVTITDSRGNSTTTNLTIQVLSWSLPSAIISLQRLNNFYSETNLTVDANYSSLDNKNTITIQYQIKKVSDASYGSLTTIQDNVQTQFTADNTYEWNVKVILTDKLGSYNYILTLQKGIPIMFIDTILNSVGINCFPADSESLEVDGINILTRIAGYGEIANQVTGDWDTACGTASGIYMGVDLSNAPTSGWWYVLHIVHNNLYKRQIAFSFVDVKKIYSRVQDNGTWNNWISLTGQPKILWTNSSPSSSFAGQTIALNSSDYDLLKIYYKKTDSENNLSSVEIIKGYDTDLGYIDDSCVLFSRHMESVTDTSLQFDGANRLMPGSSTTVADNTRCIPVYVVGSKSDLF